MRYLLDTNVCIEILRGRNATLRDRLSAQRLQDLVLCSVVRAELYVGARLARDPIAELARVAAAFAEWPCLPFDNLAAESYGEIRAQLQREGNLIGGNDLLIAAIARANSLVLVTHNTREFGRVPGLQIEDWEV